MAVRPRLNWCNLLGDLTEVPSFVEVLSWRGLDWLDELREGGGLLGCLNLNWDEHSVLNNEHGSFLMLAQSNWFGLGLTGLVHGLAIALDELPCAR